MQHPIRPLKADAILPVGPGPHLDESQHSAVVDGHTRAWTTVARRNLPAGAAVLMVLHGTMQNPQRIRRATGHGFDRLAADHDVVVVYPDAYRGTWNDARRAASSPARTAGIDEPAFVETILDHTVGAHDVDRRHVFATGFSNGGQLVFRLAAHIPDRFAGFAAIGATWPTADNYLGDEPVAPVAMMLVNGTADPIVPFDGGVISLFGFKPRGTALSALDTARFFARLNKITAAPVTEHLPRHDRSGRTSVTLTAYRQEGRLPVLDYTVHGGGHVVPNPTYRAPRLVGRTTPDLDAPAAVWAFFTTLPRSTTW